MSAPPGVWVAVCSSPVTPSSRADCAHLCGCLLSDVTRGAGSQPQLGIHIMEIGSH